VGQLALISRGNPRYRACESAGVRYLLHFNTLPLGPVPMSNVSLGSAAAVCRLSWMVERKHTRLCNWSEMCSHTSGASGRISAVSNCASAD